METTGPLQSSGVEIAIARVREATRSSPYESRIYLVGGMLRDRALGMPLSGDADLVVEGDAVELARFLYDRGLSRHFPVLYPRFGTAMLTVNSDGMECAVELVTARSERYRTDSRKPDVTPGTIRDDVLRRDFTINTLLENIHSGEILDVTGRAWNDLSARLLRTPVEPRITFFRRSIAHAARGALCGQVRF